MDTISLPLLQQQQQQQQQLNTLPQLVLEFVCASCPPWQATSTEVIINLEYSNLCKISKHVEQRAADGIVQYFVEHPEVIHQSQARIELRMFQGIPKKYVELVYSWFNQQSTCIEHKLQDREAAELLYCLPDVFGVEPSSELHKSLVKSLKNCLITSNYCSLAHLSSLHFMFQSAGARLTDVLELCVSKAAKNFPIIITAMLSRRDTPGSNLASTDFMESILAHEDLTASEDIILMGAIGWCELKRLSGNSSNSSSSTHDFFQVLQHVRPSLLLNSDTFELWTAPYLTTEQQKFILNNMRSKRGKVGMTKATEGNTTIYSPRCGAQAKHKKPRWQVMTSKFSATEMLTEVFQIKVVPPSHAILQPSAANGSTTIQTASSIPLKRNTRSPAPTPSSTPATPSSTPVIKQCVFLDETESSKQPQRTRANSCGSAPAPANINKRRNSLPTKRARAEVEILDSGCIEDQQQHPQRRRKLSSSSSSASTSSSSFDSPLQTCTNTSFMSLPSSTTTDSSFLSLLPTQIFYQQQQQHPSQEPTMLSDVHDHTSTAAFQNSFGWESLFLQTDSQTPLQSAALDNNKNSKYESVDVLMDGFLPVEDLGITL